VWWGWEGKNTLHLVGLDDQGTIVLREKLARSRIRTRLANVPRCLIGIEAGIGTHYVARELIALGHDVRQVPPVYARPFRQTHKNDFRDAYAIAEAVRRPSTRCVPVKTDDQLDLQALHRLSACFAESLFKPSALATVGLPCRAARSGGSPASNRGAARLPALHRRPISTQKRNADIRHASREIARLALGTKRNFGAAFAPK
jgi:hypothetical protein